MQIQHQQNDEFGEFFILNEQQQKIAKLGYYFVDHQSINANHTYVAESLRGQGVADKLYLALISFVGEKQLKLIPTCSYIAKKWERSQNR